jgi:hypothetical protein
MGKQRSLSLSDKPVHRIYIRRTVSQEEVSNKDNFAKPHIPENSCNNKRYLVRTRRHSMNDSILTSTVEKINPYFTKSYSRSPHKVRNDYSKTTYSTHSPKRNISVTSLDTDSSTLLKSPQKKNKNLPVEADIFDFKSEPHGVQVKMEPEDDYNGEDLRKTETYSYSLLKGASKTSSVNPCFSSRKTFVKKMNSIPSKCVSKLRQEYCGKKGKPVGCVNSEKQALSGFHSKRAHIGPLPSQRHFIKSNVMPNFQGTLKFHENFVQKELSEQKNHEVAGGSGNKMTSHCSRTQHPPSITRSQKHCSSVSPTISNATSDVTMVTSSSMDSLKSATSSSSGESSKIELLNDSALLSYAIAGEISMINKISRGLEKIYYTPIGTVPNDIKFLFFEVFSLLISCVFNLNCLSATVYFDRDSSTVSYKVGGLVLYLGALCTEMIISLHLSSETISI